MTAIQTFLSWKQRSNRQKLLSLLSRLYKLSCILESKYHSFDFDGYIPKENLEESLTNSVASATAYQGFSHFYLKVLVKEASSLGKEFDNFIDIGSGKGKVCIYAAKYFAFKNIVGIEISKALI